MAHSPLPAPPTLEEIWTAIVQDRLTPRITQAMYKRLNGDGSLTGVYTAFAEAIRGISERKRPEEKAALALLVEDGGVDKAAARYDALIAAIGYSVEARPQAVEALRAKARLFAPVQPPVAANAYARLLGLDRHDISAHLELAGVFGRQGDWPRAETSYREALGIESMPPQTRAAATQRLAQVLERRGDLEGGYELHQQAGLLYADLKDSDQVDLAYSNLARNACARGKHADEEQWFEFQLKLRKAGGDQKAVADTLVSMAHAALEQGETSRAEERSLSALALYEQLGDEAEVAFMLERCASFHLARGDFAGARGLLERALAIQRQLDDQEEVLDVLRQLSGIAAGRGELHRAQDLLSEAQDIASTLGEPEAMGGVYDDHARLLATGGDETGAQEHFRRAIECFNQAGAGKNAALAHARLGSSLFRSRQFLPAKSSLNEARAILERLGNESALLAAVLRDAADVDMALGDWKTAENRLRWALSAYTEPEDREEIAATCLKLGDATFSSGDKTGGRAHWTRALALLTSLGQRDSTRGQYLTRVLRDSSGSGPR